MMRYSLGNLREWQPVGEGELVSFPLGDASVRTVQFDALCDGPTGFFARRERKAMDHVLDEGRSPEWEAATWLIGYSPGGEVSIRFAASYDVAVYCQTEEGRSCFLRFGMEAQVIPARDIPSFVNLEPRAAGPSDDVRRMMHIMELNRKAREAQLHGELARLRELVMAGKPAEAPVAPSGSPGTSGTPPATSPSAAPPSEKV